MEGFPQSHPLYVANQPLEPNRDLVVREKVGGEVLCRVPLAPPEMIDAAMTAAVRAARPMARLATYERRGAIEHCVRRFQERTEELASVLCAEAGKPIRDARTEVARLIETFRIAAGECDRLGGELTAADLTPRARQHAALWKRVPLGPCSFITPFNFPLNLVAHKVAPALAAGCPFVLKPASLTPVSALLVGEVLAECDLPPGAFSILPCRREDASPFAEDGRMKLLSFTGSPEVGWDLKRRAGKKRVVLELGGNAAVIVDEGADLEDAVARITTGAFGQSGQSCISVQRILVHASTAAAFRERLVAAALALKVGDPRDEATAIGPLISEGDAVRLESWIRSAVARGARLLCGGARRGAFLEPTLLEGVPPDERICAAEAFGPVAVLATFEDFDAALEEVNASAFGLQAGVFTRDLHRAWRAFETLEVGAVVIGDVPTFRADHLPYGGVKDSGLGREGVRFALEEMTEIRTLILRDPGR